jgi:RNAse (barnase) inhibitor barstar
MSFDIRFDEKKNILVVTLKGDFTIADFQNAMKQITQSNQYPPDTDALWDLREMDFTRVDTIYWRGIISIRKQHRERGTARIAHIVKGDFAFGMLRMYQIYSELDPNGLRQKIEIFKSISEGEKWLLSR